MKTLGRCVVLASFLGCAFLVGGRLHGEPRRLFPKTLFVDKVYATAYGYRVDYVRSNGWLASCYLPFSWFKAEEGLAQISSEPSSSLPYMSVFYEGDTVAFVRLYMPASRDHLAWGFLAKNQTNEADFDLMLPQLTY